MSNDPFLHMRVSTKEKSKWNRQAIRDGKTLAAWVKDVLNWQVMTPNQRSRELGKAPPVPSIKP